MVTKVRPFVARYLDHLGDGTGYTNGNVKVGSIGNATFDVTGGAFEDLWTSAGHGLITGDRIQFTVVGTGATPFLITTDYYVIKKDANTFQLASTLANAIAGTQIEGTGGDSAPTWTFSRMATPLKLKPASGTVYRVKSLVLMVRDATGFAEEEFANFGAALTNGLKIRVSNSDGVVTDFTDTEPIKINSDFHRVCGARDMVTDLGATNDYIAATLKFDEAFGQELRLNGTYGEFLEVLLQDDLTGLVALYCYARGHEE